jgi:hypothetical protein
MLAMRAENVLSRERTPEERDNRVHKKERQPDRNRQEGIGAPRSRCEERNRGKQESQEPAA